MAKFLSFIKSNLLLPLLERNIVAEVGGGKGETSHVEILYIAAIF